MLEAAIVWPPHYTVKKHKRARSVKLRATKKNGLVITIPYRFNVRELPGIIEQHKQWITKQLAKLAAQTTDVLPEQIEFKLIHEIFKIQYLSCDKKLTLHIRPTKEIILLGKTVDKAACKRKLLFWVKAAAKKILVPLLRELSEQLQLPFDSVNIRDQQTLWGSCTSQKMISLNYKLIFLPYELARHVMIHELCHTKHLNHSDKFWRLVASFDPAWEQHKRALRNADDYVPSWI